MTATQEALAERVRAALPDDRAVREVAMFGGLSFLVDGSLVLAVSRNGDLLVRIDAVRHDELLDRHGAVPAVMGERPMGAGWIKVLTEGVADDEHLAFWTEVGLQASARSKTPRPRVR